MKRDHLKQARQRQGSLRIADSLPGRLVVKQSRCTASVIHPSPFDSRSPIRKLNTVCPYYTMFPLSFPLDELGNAQKGEWVLDPFCGRGTTLFASRLHGLRCVGIDSNPIAAAISAAKVSDVSAEGVIDLANVLLNNSPAPADIPTGEFWRMCYHPATLRSICVLRERLLQRCFTQEEIVLRALILGILHGPRYKSQPTYLSNQMPRTYATKPTAAVRYWSRLSTTKPPNVDVHDAIARRARYSLSAMAPPVEGEVYYGDARNTHKLVPLNRRFNWVITSPPYFGMQSYRPDQWLRNWFLGGSDTVEYGSEGQLSHHSKLFTSSLSSVWNSVAKRCESGARLIVRYGNLPSRPLDAVSVICESLESSEVNWRILRKKDAGSASSGRRQSDQFGKVNGSAATEIDVYAKLEG